MSAMSTLAVVVMAAGVGSRFGGPKQLVPVGPNGETLLEYTVFDAVRSGAERVVLVVRRETEDAFRTMIGARMARHVRLEFVRQEVADIPPGFEVARNRTKPWGTGHAVLAARHAVDGPFLLANGDDFYGARPIAAVLHFLRRQPDGWALATWPLAATLSPAGPVSRGVCTVGPEGQLLAVQEHTEVAACEGGVRHRDGTLTGREPVSMNLWGFRADVIAILQEEFTRFLAAHGADVEAEYQLPTAVDAARRAGLATVWAVPAGETWFGLTHANDLESVRARLAALVAAGSYPSPLWP